MLIVGIIGAGNMGRAHANACKTYGADIACVHDVQLSAATDLAKECGAKPFDGLEEFFAIPMDAVVIAAPPPVRIEPVSMACERGIHLMIEKPPALTMSDGIECLAHIEKSDIMAAVGFQLRYDALYEMMKDKLAGQEVHLVRTVCTIDYYLNFGMSPWFLQSEISGGPIAEQAIHLLDSVRYMFGDVRAVQAHALAAKNMAYDRDEFDAENSIQMTYELDNGVFGTHLNHCGCEGFSFDMEMIGPHLRLAANLATGRVVGFMNGEPVDESSKPGSLGLDKTGAWLRAIETSIPELIRSPFSDALHTLALVEAAVDSRGTGRFVQIKHS